MTPPLEFIEPRERLAPGVRALTTTRAGGISRGPYESFNLADHVGDAADAVSANRLALKTALGLDHVQWLQQVHGVGVLAAGAATVALEPEADAAWTTMPGLALAVLTADCLPVVLARHDGSAVGVAHAGWRGLLAGVIPRLAAALGEGPALTAWLGPGISAAAYEVGEEVAGAAREAGGVLRPGRATGKYQLDLAATAVAQLRELGLAAIEACEVCAARSSLTYSYRRDGTTGRMATLVWIGRE